MNEPSMEAGVRPRGVAAAMNVRGRPNLYKPARDVDPICAPK
jgi:hypothetical protein